MSVIFPGWYWSATTGRHVGFESWLERDRLLLMDFDRDVVGIGSQPFWLHWHDGERVRRHAPDYFVRRADGSAVVVDVRADDRIEPKDAEAFEVTRLVCTQAGWRFERLGIPDAVLLANIRWLSRYRHPRCLHDRPRPGSGDQYFAWLQQSADPFDLLDTARRILTDGTGKAPSPDQTLTMVFHPQVVTLAGLLAGREWERRAVATGHVTWLVEQITARNILLGYVPKDRKDPLIQWVEQHFSTHKFVAFHRSPRIYDAFFPRETIPPPRQPGEDDSETRWSPFHPCYRC